MNVFNTIGRIGKDAVVRYTQGGSAVTGWSMAVDSGFGDKKQTLWFDCALWGERGTKIADYIKKGDRIGVTGELGTREHDGKTYFTLNVKDVTLLGAKGGEKPSERGPARGAQAAPSPAPADGGFDDDEIPFN